MTSTNAGGIVDFFALADGPTGTDVPQLVFKQSSPEIKDGFNFNAVALAHDRTVYASVMSFFGKSPPTAPAVPQPLGPGECVKKGAIYMWRAGEDHWNLVARVSGANGLVLSQEDSHLLVNSSGTGRVFNFKRNRDGGLTLQSAEGYLLAGCSAPDNLKMLADGAMIALATPNRLITGLYLILQHSFGRSFVSPPGDTYTWKPGDREYANPGKVFGWSSAFVGPSTTHRLGNWWLGSQMVDGNIAYRRVDERP